MDYIGKTVKFHHRVATGKSLLGAPFKVESKDPFSDGKITQQIRHQLPIPTELVVEDAIVLSRYVVNQGEEPRATLIYASGVPMSGSDWQSAVKVAHDIPHESHSDAAGEQFWYSQSEKDAKTISDMTAGIKILQGQLAEATKDKKKKD